eukprot:GSChrysophyteH2.ASY1.ANO1.785.1 assembled CDS
MSTSTLLTSYYYYYYDCTSELKLGDRVTTIPTIGFNVEEVKPSAARFTIWDIGGQIKIRELWMHYVGEGSTPDVLLWVVDSLCPERLQESAAGRVGRRGEQREGQRQRQRQGQQQQQGAGTPPPRQVQVLGAFIACSLSKQKYSIIS